MVTFSMLFTQINYKLKCIEDKFIIINYKWQQLL
jgi:hypothetical protein